MDAVKNITLHYTKAKMSHCTNLDFDRKFAIFYCSSIPMRSEVYISTRFSETMFWHSLVLWTTKHQLQLNDINANLDGTYWIYLLMILTPSTISYHSSTFKGNGTQHRQISKINISYRIKTENFDCWAAELSKKRLRGYLM